LTRELRWGKQVDVGLGWRLAARWPGAALAWYAFEGAWRRHGFARAFELMRLAGESCRKNKASSGGSANARHAAALSSALQALLTDIASNAGPKAAGNVLSRPTQSGRPFVRRSTSTSCREERKLVPPPLKKKKKISFLAELPEVHDAMR